MIDTCPDCDRDAAKGACGCDGGDEIHHGTGEKIDLHVAELPESYTPIK